MLSDRQSKEYLSDESNNRITLYAWEKRNHMRRTFFVLLMLAFALPAMAVGKVTTDPNALGAVQKPEAVDTADSRLGQKITYTASRKMVSAVLDEITKSTGVVFRAGYNSKDWQVRDRKMSIFVKDVPLSQLMNSMSHVMKFKWERAGNPGAWTYRLYMDRRSLLDAEAQRVREEEKEEAERAKKRAEGLAQYAKLGTKLSDSEMSKLSQDSPFMFALAQATRDSDGGSDMGRSMGTFFQEAPMAWNAIANGQRLDMQGSDLSGVAQAGLVKSIRQMLSIEKKFGGRSGNSGLPLDDMATHMDRVNIKFNQTLEMAKGMPASGMLLGDMTVEYDGRSTTVPFIDPNSAMAKFIGKVMIEADQQGRTMDEVMKDHMSELTNAVVNEMKTETTGEPINEHPTDDPDLQAKVTLKPDSAKLADVEKALAETAKLGVVSDSFGDIYGGYSPRGQVPSTEPVIKDVLDKIGDVYVYNWDKQSGIIELRDRNWFKKRAVQIPEEWLEKWRKELTDTGTLGIDSLAQIALLTQEQLMSNVATDDVLRSGSLLGIVFGNRDILRFYGGLASDQRSMLMSKSGMDLAMLSQDQFDDLSKIIKTKLGSKFFENVRSVAITCERKAADDKKLADKSISYKISLIADGKKIDENWTLTTPQYVAPKPKTDKPKKADADKPAADSTKPSDSAKPADSGKTQPAK